MSNSFTLFIVFLLCSTSLFSQEDDQAISEELVSYCLKNNNKKIGRGQCSDLVFYALSELNKSLYRDTRKVSFKEEDLKPGDIIHLEWKKNLKSKQHVMIVIEHIEGSRVKVAHQNFNNQLKVVYTNYDLKYEEEGRNRQVTVYRLIQNDED